MAQAQPTHDPHGSAESIVEEEIAEYQRVLDEIGRLPADWDTYGSPPVQHAALDAGARLLRMSVERALPAPHIAPISGGGIHLEWEVPHHLMQFAIGARGEFGYALFRDDEVVAEGEVPTLDESQAIAHMQWFSHA